MEKFSFSKLFKSPFTWLFWVKAIMVGLGLCGILLVSWIVYRAFFKKTQLSQIIKTGKWSTVNVIQQNDRKKTLIPFVEGFVEQRASEKFNTGLRTGIRFEW